MLSIMEVLGKPDFNRIRVGIGRPPSGIDPTDYVLGPFSAEELPVVEEVLSRTASAVQMLLEAGPRKTMEEFNQNN